MKRQLKWALSAALLLAVVFAALLALRAQRARATAAPVATLATAAVELADSDVTRAKTQDMTQGLAVSGTLKAVNSAIVKARVAGELQGLNVREGDFVKAGQVLAHIDASEYNARLQQARQQADAALAQRDIAQRQYDNNKALVVRGFISQSALDTSLATLQGADASHRAALSGVDVTRKSVDDTVLRAPLSGQIAQRLAQSGERLAIDARILEIVDLSQLELEATLSATESLTLQPGQRAELHIDGSPTPITARLARINPSAQTGSRSVLAYLRLDNAAAQGLALRQGLFVQGRLGTARVSALSVPLDAVRTDKATPYVQTVEDARVVHRAVTLGLRGEVGETAMVAVQGLPENAVVIKGSAGALREGSAVRFTAAPGPLPAASAASASSAP